MCVHVGLRSWNLAHAGLKHSTMRSSHTSVPPPPSWCTCIYITPHCLSLYSPLKRVFKAKLPFKDKNAPNESINYVFDYCDNFPYWAQLPHFKKEENMGLKSKKKFFLKIKKKKKKKKG